MRPAAAPGQSDSTPTPSNPAKSATPRGPPRKPKQSGHALWVGNLAPGTSIVELKDYFSQGAATEVESVFLISKSNCAFVNYKTEAACLAALARFHDSRLRGARLVCRVRRGNTDLAGLSVTPPSLKDGDGVLVSSPGDEDGGGGRETNPTPGPHRYFIVKSLTVEDLEMSRQSGIWATQTHNEDHLNQAYETADHVYLIFSANKSGEYYGYARMMSPIKDDEVLARAMPPRPDHLFLEPDDLNVIATPATSTAPNGRIINDTARGTIFWEADTSEDEDEEEEEEEEEESQQAAPAEEWGGLQLIGKPFRIRWLSTERVPFHRTRGLRNPWNANREVKIARDGTELAPSVGEKLVLLFHPEEGGPGNAS
ncbi:hypothetical protein P175DRAFT_0290706 [Aspergillus ochraceoroseus IBT 24754]|nr:uncharacterized protein P175DRAFT_0290706 [Aspergillus ochraceoroseus IBT 24754]PTU19185.1 hypothetical protein P175DRAFT_0290706 [Aspergillus ochraceoroseus IBT 24754]